MTQATTTATNTITFQTASQLALWNHELTGQFSDGMWENTRPHDHWKFWGKLTAMTGKDLRVVTDKPWECKKTGYDFNALADVVGGRMVNIGRMGMVIGATADHFQAAEYMPETLSLWMACMENGGWQYDFVAKYMAKVTPDVAESYYMAKYTEHDLKRDLRVIKAIMKTVKG